MPKPSNAQLKPSPFVTHRDPQTGEWMILDRIADKIIDTSAIQDKDNIFFGKKKCDRQVKK